MASAAACTKPGDEYTAAGATKGQIRSPSSSDSSSSTDNLQSSSQFGTSSGSMGANLMGADGGHFSDDTIKQFLHALASVDTSSGRIASDDIHMKKKKGLLASICVLLDKLCFVFAGIFGSVMYYLLQKTQGSIDDTWTIVLITLCATATLICVILFGHSSYLKESESIEGFGSGIFKWLLLMVLVFFNVVLFILLRAFPFASNLVLLIVGTLVVSLLELIIWCWFFNKKWPEILQEMNAGPVGRSGMSKSPSSTGLELANSSSIADSNV